jgi:hypothetical protein
MNNLKQLLATPVGPRRVPVPVKVDGMVPVLGKDDKPAKNPDGSPKMKPGKVDAEFAVNGMPDAFYLSLQTMPEHKKQLKAKMFTHHLRERHKGQNYDPGEFTVEDVDGILMVTHYLETPEGQEPMTETDVAILSKEHGLVYSALFAACLQIVGNTDETQNVSPEVKAGQGN